MLTRDLFAVAAMQVSSSGWVYSDNACFKYFVSCYCGYFAGKPAEMAIALVQLSLCAVSVIQLTSSQPACDVMEQHVDASSCGNIEQMFRQLIAVNSHLQTAVSQLRRDVAELKADKSRNTLTGLSSTQSNNVRDKSNLTISK